MPKKIKKGAKGKGWMDIVNSLVDEIPVIGSFHSKLRKLKPLSKAISVGESIVSKAKPIINTVGYGKKKKGKK